MCLSNSKCGFGPQPPYQKTQSEMTWPNSQSIETAWPTSHRSKWKAKDLTMNFKILWLFDQPQGRQNFFLLVGKHENFFKKREHSSGRNKPKTLEVLMRAKSRKHLLKKKISNESMQDEITLERTGIRRRTCSTYTVILGSKLYISDKTIGSRKAR